jgi:hypothetical protein
VTPGRWVPGWTETHTQALAPLDFEPVAERVHPSAFTCDPPYHRLDCNGENCDARASLAPGTTAAIAAKGPPLVYHCRCGLVALGVREQTFEGSDGSTHCFEGCVSPPPPQRRRRRSWSDTRGMDPGLFC